MLFTSLEFVFIFFPLTWIIFFFLSRKYKSFLAVFLLITSWVFCFLTSIQGLVILLFSVIFNYIIGSFISKKNGNNLLRWTIFGIVANITVLFYFKYASGKLSFLIENSDKMSENYVAFGIPLGLSFYTLFQISYLIDLYKKRKENLPLINYALTVSMFSQLPAGPILVYKNAYNKFKDIGRNDLNMDMVNKGVSLFVFGLYKRALFAQPMSLLVNEVYDKLKLGSEITVLDSLIASWGFLLQLYFDFSAYSDMAIGIALCFGIQLPINFNSPLKAKSAGDYILRWHISLIAFTRDYVFVPVSNSVRKYLKGSSVKKQLWGWILGTFAAYMVINTWHSPTLNFLLYGIIVGVFVIISQMTNLKLQTALKLKSHKFLKLLYPYLSQLMLLIVASIITMSLRAENMQMIQKVIKGIFIFPMSASTWFEWKSVKLFGYGTLGVSIILFMSITSLIAISGPNTMEIFKIIRIKKTVWYTKYFWNPTLIWGIIIGVLLFLYLILGDSSKQDFIYARF
ncbi:MBOAT family O-acyltransferase [Galbibacter pacificus]|uniref:MBOAT family protein n=1 Tax=Galbibacter pacificus TaxID=2996052 RepID=A0ABT6FNC4_9FLAO|nr:hypothetical protein [Galbibacter pacificus]MDG3581285.1 hypothetical protein [Galbibacter pacificus]MDG3584763.1 hypothetical protein [Galbibacter pacificus]